MKTSRYIASICFALAVLVPTVASAAFPAKWGNFSSGSHQFFSAPNSASIATPAGAFTIEARFKLTSVSTFQAVAAVFNTGFGGGNNANILIDDGSVGHVSCQSSSTAGGTTKEIFSLATISANVEVHIACTFDGSNLRIYINGVLDNTLAASLTRTGATGKFEIGDYDETQGYVDGQITMVRYWNTALSGATILANYCTEIGSNANLFGEWTLDNTTTDNSGNGNTLTASGGAGYTPVTSSTCPSGGAAVFNFLRLLEI